MLPARADTSSHDPLFGEAPWPASTASGDPHDLPRHFSPASASVDRHSSAKEDAGAADGGEMQAWTLSSLEAAPLDASSVAAMDGDAELDSTAAVWRRLGFAGRSAGHSGTRFPSGFILDDMQGSSAGLPLGARLAPASNAASGGRAGVEALHNLHDPKGRGTGALSAVSLNVCAMCHWLYVFIDDRIDCHCFALIMPCIASHAAFTRIKAWIGRYAHDLTCGRAGKGAAASGGRRAEGLLISRYTPGNAAAVQRSDEQV